MKKSVQTTAMVSASVSLAHAAKVIMFSFG
jgi:hypothetical protein